jgi:hypothetical protein
MEVTKENAWEDLILTLGTYTSPCLVCDARVVPAMPNAFWRLQRCCAGAHRFSKPIDGVSYVGNTIAATPDLERCLVSPTARP